MTAGMTPCTLRPARHEDIDAILRLWREASAVPSVTDDAESLRNLLDRDSHALLIAELDGRIAGSLIAAWDGWRASFYRLAVAPSHRRLGLARALVAAGEAQLRARGARRFTALVDTGEEHALAFWTAAGYRAQHERLRFVRDLA